jgi:hypothetical protein
MVCFDARVCGGSPQPGGREECDECSVEFRACDLDDIDGKRLCVGCREKHLLAKRCRLDLMSFNFVSRGLGLKK